MPINGADLRQGFGGRRLSLMGLEEQRFPLAVPEVPAPLETRPWGLALLETGFEG